MCGFSGIYSYAGERIKDDELKSMHCSLSTRGPDGQGFWIKHDYSVGLSHRRLSIIDLTESGAQPMEWRDGRYRIVYNGEIYNYRELREGLEGKGYTFKSHSDTEVLLALYAEEGKGFVNGLRGMFALAIWDEVSQGIFLARDQFGVKPLYLSDDGKVIRFASQVKTLLAGGGVSRAPDPAGYVGYCLLGSVPEPFTLYRSIRALPAGSTLWVTQSGEFQPNIFWSLGKVISDSEQGMFETGSSIKEALLDSMQHHLLSDVPVGLFLSSGIDSSVLAALASSQGQQINAVTLGFEEYYGTRDDEVPTAIKTAKELRLKHEIHRLGSSEFLGYMDNLMQSMDQPSIDGVNTYFVSLAANRAGLKVAISGLGGDELFAGYPSFRDVPRLASLPRTPAFGRWVRRISSPVISRLSSPKYASLLEYSGSYSGAYLLRRAVFMPWELDQILDHDFVEQGLQELAIMERLEETVAGISNPRLKVTSLELSWYMRNQLLRDADWAGMAHSVEIRVPFIDVDLFESVLLDVSGNNIPSKEWLATLLPDLMRKKMLARPKTGFSVPIRQWLQDKSIKDASDRGIRGWSKLVLRNLATEHPEIWAK